ncbi:fimbria/pilus periplasmic chaperone [Novosphingobium sp. G106]|uniref:fimbrial biogenesis chaperone n=1 Tax=Novosphingobium sp. G106 TaxID=2849500 RepID=UPI001C2D7D75|nr:fimbria/pilus periplasmic chaperone [Novosphingobium sp. G106]MBV1691307.1 fimbria/pilus periplasmic chaperone [Novosphingobium sp. G106]
MSVIDFRRASYPLVLAAACTLAPEAVRAGVVVDSTRVVYISTKREVSVSMRNVGDRPSLVQIWIDAGDPSVRPGNDTVPFALTPPLFRLDPAKAQTLRLIYTREPLAKDRETVFWLNVLDIPPRASSGPEPSNRLEMAFRHRLKLFFRPSGLPGSADSAAASVTWSVARRGEDVVLEARNPTPFFVSFAEVQLAAGSGIVSGEPGMLAPFANQQFKLSRQAAPLIGQATVQYGFVNDFGAIVRGEAVARAAS